MAMWMIVVYVLSHLDTFSMDFYPNPVVVHYFNDDEPFYQLTRFWTNTGLCPAGDINHEQITQSLLSDAMQLNLQYIAALPGDAITHVRIHWLLELLRFEGFTQAGMPIYAFDDLDKFLLDLVDMQLHPVIEFMGNPGQVFVKNPVRNAEMWEDFSYRITKHYLNLLGAATIEKWKFESWNEPDELSYNKLNFTIKDYLIYMKSIRHGLTRAGRRTRPSNDLYFPLRGPAGLFKNQAQHPLCWTILQYCNIKRQACPFDILSYHKKADGNEHEITSSSLELFQRIFAQMSKLQDLPLSNDEADPYSGWSTPRLQLEDAHYAQMLVHTVFDHWQAKVNGSQLQNLESISHDNAFLSYHPHEFSQRTLLAHFRMNESLELHSQFIEKPVYAALGMLSRLSSYAKQPIYMSNENQSFIRILATQDKPKEPKFLSWLVLPSTELHLENGDNFMLQLEVPLQENLYYLAEFLDNNHTNPAALWRSWNQPSYPSAKQREQMRMQQSLKIFGEGPLYTNMLLLNLDELTPPWVFSLRLCSSLLNTTIAIQQLKLLRITKAELLLVWQPAFLQQLQCLKSYEVWFQPSATAANASWIHVSEAWHLPFPSFQYAPENGLVNGFYKIRASNIFNLFGPFSEAVEYFDI